MRPHMHSPLTCVNLNGRLWWENNCCLFHRQLGGLHGAGITISILDKKTPHKQRAVGQEDSCTLCFHFIPTPRTKGPRGGGIKGRDAGTLARFFLYSSSRPFSRPEKGGFKPLRIVPERLLWKGGPHKDTARCFKRRVRRYDFVHSDWWQRRKSRLRQIIGWIFWVPFYFGCTVTGRSAALHTPTQVKLKMNATQCIGWFKSAASA